METEILEEILKNQKTKFRCLNQVHDLTRELAECLAEGDMEKLELTLQMRQNQIQVCIDMDRRNDGLIGNASSEETERLGRLIHLQERAPAFCDPLEQEIYSMTQRIAKQLQITKDYDKEFTGKLIKSEK
ncbi:MAG: hypothetical protein ACI4VM_04440 [Anaerovoracaceae bacterium]